MNIAGLGSPLHRLVVRSERAYDSVRRRLPGFFDLTRKNLEIVTYHTYGTPDHLEVRGRLLVAFARREANVSDSRIRNATRIVRQFLTYEVPDVAIYAGLGDKLVEGRTDEEGYFRIDLPTGNASNWMTATVSSQRARSTQALILVPPPSCEYLVISDIDDTILPTGATRMATVIRTTMLGNARTRRPFPGVADFYRSLVAGRSGADDNPVFYVSSGPWNLYRFLATFIESHELPIGPVMLRDFGVDSQTFIYGTHEDHKLHEIQRILDTYPQLPCVLIGDSGQRDPEIYATVARNNPQRVLALYIREIGSAERQAQVAGLAAELEPPMVWGLDTSVFADHAASIGLVSNR